MSRAPVAVIGAGLAGSEAALVLAREGIDVVLYEMRPHCTTPAHKTGKPAELVCSNSLKSDRMPTAHGLLKAELAILRSPLLRVAESVRVPAGTALAVDREAFSSRVEELLENDPHVTLLRQERSAPPQDTGICIIAAGPLMSDSLAAWMQREFSSHALFFYDAIAPIVAADSVDMDKAFHASRWDDSCGDYLNCPFTAEEYRAFHTALLEADRVTARKFEETRFFEACLPIEVVAGRGFDTLAFGTMRPVGLTNPHTGRRAYAVCQLRKENAAGVSLNIVGFQTRLTVPEQQRVFRLIPGLEKAVFLRYGSVHRNTYLNAPALLNDDLSFRKNGSILVAGQLCGNEGYTESIATGNLAAAFARARFGGTTISPPPSTTACGALLRYVTRSSDKNFCPTNINFGILDPLSRVGRKKPRRKEQHEQLCERALAHMTEWHRENLA